MGCSDGRANVDDDDNKMGVKHIWIRYFIGCLFVSVVSRFACLTREAVGV